MREISIIIIIIILVYQKLGRPHNKKLSYLLISLFGFKLFSDAITI